MNETPYAKHEIEIARLSILPEDSYLKAIVDMVSDIAQANGIGKKDTRHLEQVLMDIFRNIVKYGFQGDTCQPLDVIVIKRLHTLVIALEDRGLPFDYENLEHGEDKRFKSYMSKGYADAMNFQSLGNRGNRTEIVKNLPSRDIREEMDISEHHEHLKAEPAASDAEFIIKVFDHKDVNDLVRLVYKCYGYTYANEFMYYPEQIESFLHCDMMMSCAAYDSDKKLIGHLALVFSKPGARVGESGEAVVDPRYRGRKIFQKMKDFLKQESASKGIVGIYSEAVTVHPYSQKGNLDIGASEIGYLLGYSPGTVSFQNITDDEKPRRQSVALMYLPVLESTPVKVYVQEAYKDILTEIYKNVDIKRRIITEGRGFKFDPDSESKISVKVRADHNQGIITVQSYGNSTLSEIKYYLRKLSMERVDCIYADLPLNLEGTAQTAEALRELGFFFGYIIPAYSDSDVLRLQYLNNVEISRDDIKTASPFGEKLLGFIFQDMAHSGQSITT
jgi:anti-sigma regulatory factor (Ser/Thr protein kinase)